MTCMCFVSKTQKRTSCIKFEILFYKYIWNANRRIVDVIAQFTTYQFIASMTTSFRMFACIQFVNSSLITNVQARYVDFAINEHTVPTVRLYLPRFCVNGRERFSAAMSVLWPPRVGRCGTDREFSLTLSSARSLIIPERCIRYVQKKTIAVRLQWPGDVAHARDGSDGYVSNVFRTTSTGKSTTSWPTRMKSLVVVRICHCLK